MSAEARNEGKTVHFASFMDLCHLKNLELDPNFENTKGQVVLRGDIWKDDSGLHAVFTEQGSSEFTSGGKSNGHYIKATRMRRTSSRRNICLYQGQNGRCINVIENSKGQNVQIFVYVYQSTNGPNHGPVWKTQSFLLSEILDGHLLAGLLWERQFEKVFFF